MFIIPHVFRLSQAFLDLCSQTLSVCVNVNHQKPPQESKSVQELQWSNIASVAMSL